MSNYMEIQTQFTDREHLVAALTEMGFQPQVHEQPVQLRDYHGHSMPAHIVVPKEQLGGQTRSASWASIGFYKGADGVYGAVIDDFDRQGINRDKRYDSAWLGKLAQGYQCAKSMAVAKAKGYTFIGKTYAQNAAGQQVVRLQFGVR